MLGQPERLKELEAIVHPLVRAERDAFLAAAVAARAPVAVLDIPLLFETGGERAAMRSSSSPRAGEVQRARVLARPGMTEEKFAAIAGKADARRGKAAPSAHFLVDTGRGFAAAERQVGDILRALAGTAGRRAAPGRPGPEVGRMREIVLDTETTGLDPAAGDRLIEIGCVELVNHFPTGRTFHAYVNPQRSVSQGAFSVHGLSEAFLADKPVFAAVAEPFLEFVGDARLVIHNAGFDIGFLNAEFARTGHPALDMMRVVDTLSLARRKHPGAPNNLDALCARYGIDNSRRTKHGALLDAELLAEVYIELIGGKQADLNLSLRPAVAAQSSIVVAARSGVAISRLTDAERDAHLAFIASLGVAAIWRDYVVIGE